MFFLIKNSVYLKSMNSYFTYQTLPPKPFFKNRWKTLLGTNNKAFILPSPRQFFRGPFNFIKDLI